MNPDKGDFDVNAEKTLEWWVVWALLLSLPALYVTGWAVLLTGIMLSPDDSKWGAPPNSFFDWMPLLLVWGVAVALWWGVAYLSKRRRK